VRAVLPTIIVLAVRANDQPTSLRWSLATPSGAASSPGIDAQFAYDAVGRQLLMFGGLDASGDPNDLWPYSVGTIAFRRRPEPKHRALATDVGTVCNQSGFLPDWNKCFEPGDAVKARPVADGRRLRSSAQLASAIGVRENRVGNKTTVESRF
jgi:hypothetical protein